MSEIELKLQLPAESLQPVITRLRTLGARRARLQTAYFDTPDQALARSGIAWRIRRQGRHWVQTLKSGTGLVREEHEVGVPGMAGEWPVPSADRHTDSASGSRLSQVLHAAGIPPTERFRTDFTRLSAPLRTRRGWVELSLDRGSITAGESSLPLCELEIELIKGSPRAVTEVAGIMLRRHGLWIDLRSKAQRGHVLASGQTREPARGADACMLSPAMSMPEAWASVARKCSVQILANASQIAADEGGAAEHVHQLRVGLRRLRAAIRLFKPVIANADRFSDQAGALARALGAHRDRDVMSESLWPQLTRAGAPLAALPVAAHDTRPTEIVRAPAHQRWLLELIETCEAPMPDGVRRVTRASSADPAAVSSPAPAPEVEGSDGDDAAKDLKAILTGRLDAGHRSIRRKLRRFDSLSDDERHRLRRQLKRLRYGLEFCSALLPRKKTRQMIRALARAQDALGEYNDAVIALAAYRAHAESDPRAWFAAGWLSGQLPGTLDRCRDELEKLSAVAAPWGKYDRRGPPTRKNPTASAKC